MYSFTAPPYSLPGPGQNTPSSLPSYSRFARATPGSQPTGSNPLFPPGFLSANPLMSPLSNLSGLPSSFATNPPSCSQVTSPQSLYPLQHSLSMTGSELGSPTDSISPQESILADTPQDSSDPQSPYMDFSTYLPSTKSRAFTTSTGSSCYFSPSFTFPTSSSGGPGGAMYTPPAHPNTMYSCPDSSSPLSTGVAPLTNTPGWNPYPMPYMPNPVHAKSVPKLSYDSPRYKLTPERAVPLIKWFEEHKDHPYPTRHEKILLCQGTQLTFTQVSTWFANARRRMKKASLEEDDNKSGTSDYTDSPKSPEENPETVMETRATFSSTVSITEVDDSQEGMKKQGEENVTTTVTNLWDSSAY